jgi:hypothetical protein
VAEYAPTIGGLNTPRTRRQEDDLAPDLRPDPVLHHALCQVEWRKDVDLEIPPHQVQRDFADGPAFADAGVVDQHVELEPHYTSSVVGFEQIELFDAQTG